MLECRSSAAHRRFRDVGIENQRDTLVAEDFLEEVEWRMFAQVNDIMGRGVRGGRVGHDILDHLVDRVAMMELKGGWDIASLAPLL
jgi:hypothetical protein